MPLQQQDKPPADKPDRQRRNDVIGKHVLHALGQPRDLHRVQVRQLWGEYYRVNILIGSDAAVATVAHSYFLTTDTDGNIVASSPALTRRY